MTTQPTSDRGKVEEEQQVRAALAYTEGNLTAKDIAVLQIHPASDYLDIGGVALRILATALRAARADSKRLQLLLAWEAEELTEGQAVKATGLDRVSLRVLRETEIANGMEIQRPYQEATIDAARRAEEGK